MVNCPICNDTGVIETGNNDLPCDCEVGDTAIFNVVGGQMTGDKVKEELQKWQKSRERAAILQEVEQHRRGLVKPIRGGR